MEKKRAYAVVILVLLLPASARWLPAAEASANSADTFKVAAVQFNPRIYRLEENVERLSRAFEEAARRGAKVIVAPEMATTGYLYKDREDIKAFVDTVPGKTTRRFAELARQYGCYLAWGMPEKDLETGLFYNSMALLGPEGYVGKYRKSHLWECEAHWAAWGNLGIPVFSTPYGNVSLLICQDANYMETFRIAMLAGADIVCFATNSSGQTVAHLQARAVRNGLYVISANRSDAETDRRTGQVFQMKGSSAVWSPSGEKLAEAGIDTEEIICATIDPTRFAEKQARKDERRPELYKGLIRHIAPWNELATKKPRSVRAVALQYEPVIGDIRENRSVVEDLLQAALAGDENSKPKQTLVVLPELSLTGPIPTATVAQHAEDLHGETATWFGELAARYRAYVVFAMIEREGGALYNTAVLVAPGGRVAGRVRKIHLNKYDRSWARPGKRFAVFKANGLGRVGILVGNDAYLPEPALMLAVERADIVAVPSSWHGEVAGDGSIRINPNINPHSQQGGMVLWDDMAWSNLYYVVVANFVGTGKRFLGRSGIYSLDPIYGIESPGLARGIKEQTVVGLFQTLNNGERSHWIDQQKYIASRRPDDLYYPLIKRRKPSANLPERVPLLLAP